VPGVKNYVLPEGHMTTYVPSHMLTALKPNWCFDVLEKEAIMHSEWPEFSTYVDESNCSIRRSYHMMNCTSYSGQDEGFKVSMYMYWSLVVTPTKEEEKKGLCCCCCCIVLTSLSGQMAARTANFMPWQA
jgi:hypothetical protein